MGMTGWSVPWPWTGQNALLAPVVRVSSSSGVMSDAVPHVALLRGLPDPVVFLADDGAIVEITDRFCSIGGWDRDALIGRSCFDLFDLAVRPEVIAAFDRWVSDGTSPLERRVVRLPVSAADGRGIDVEVRIDRTDHGFAATVHDLSHAASDVRTHLLDAVAAPVVNGEVLAGIAGRVGEAFRWDSVVLWVIANHGGSMRARAVWQRESTPDPQFREATLQLALVAGQAPAGQAWAGDTVVVADDLSDDPRFDGGSGVFVPVRAGHRPVGVLELTGSEPIRPGLWLRSELESLSGVLGHLVERYRDRMQADALGDRLALALDAGRFGVWTLDVRSGAAEWSPRMAELHGIDPALSTGAPDTVFANVVEDDRVALGSAVAASRNEDEPASVDYRVVGDDGDMRWISTRLTRVQDNGGPPMLSAVSADNTDRKRAELAARRRTSAVEGLQWVSRAIIGGRELHDTAEAVVEAATGVLGAHLGVVLYPEPGEVSDELAWAVAGLGADVPAPSPPDHLELPQAVVTGARVVNVRDLSKASGPAAFIAHLGLPVSATGSALLVPIRGTGGRNLGLMVFTNPEPSYFTDNDSDMAASIGSSTGVAIENAQQHEQRRLAAMAFQRRLLPRPAIDIPELDVCVRYHPGRDGMDVGGDWYDVIELNGGRIGLAVGDVCGHGIESAANMGQFRYSFRALVQSSPTPAEALAAVNRLALNELETTATMAYVELDPRSGSCAVWSCGHLPPLIATADGSSARWLDDPGARGPMLGFLDEIEVSPVRTSLECGELLMLYTDGLVERRGEHLDVGLERLARAFADRSPGLDDLCDEIYADLAMPGPDADDTVVLAVRRR